MSLIAIDIFISVGAIESGILTNTSIIGIAMSRIWSNSLIYLSLNLNLTLRLSSSRAILILTSQIAIVERLPITKRIGSGAHFLMTLWSLEVIIIIIDRFLGNIGKPLILNQIHLSILLILTIGILLIRKSKLDFIIGFELLIDIIQIDNSSQIGFDSEIILNVSLLANKLAITIFASFWTFLRLGGFT